MREKTRIYNYKIELIFSRAKQGVAWLKILLQTHSSQLMALGNQELLAKFGPCIGMLEYRVEQLNQLAR